jgi:chromosomal replication initiation ATPase DnaA
MRAPGLDPRFTFESFVVGPSNRLAAAAALRVAETPGKTYNPLFLYGASGLGKTHLLMAIGNLALRVQPGLHVICDSLDRVVGGTAGPGLTPARPGDEFGAVQLLLLDDVQLLAGDRRAQDTLLAWWDMLSARGTQIVLAADRPPSEIDHIDHRLLSRLCAGLIADIAPLDYDTRVMLVRRKSEERGHALAAGVAEAVARVAFANVRELQGGLNRVMAAQELDGRVVTAEQVDQVLGLTPARQASEEFASFFADVAGAVAEIATRVSPEQRLVDAILRFEGEGYRTYRLEAALRDLPSAETAAELVEAFAADVERLAVIAAEIGALQADAPELARTDLLRDPDRVLEAEALVAQVRDRQRPLPEPPPGPGFQGLTVPEGSPAFAAMREIAGQPGARHNPLFIVGPAGSGKSSLLVALAQQVRSGYALLPIALVSAAELVSELGDALRHRQVEVWRARYRRARLLIVDDVDRAGDSESVRDELFRLFDVIRRSGGQLVFAAERDPAQRTEPDDRLHAFFADATVRPVLPPPFVEPRETESGSDNRREERTTPAEVTDPWFLDREKVLLPWPYIEDWLEADLE